MTIKCLIDYGISLKKDKIYKATKIQKGWFALIDETHEEYVYPSKLFEVVRNTSAVVSVNESIEERPDGKGFWNGNIPSKDSRSHDFMLKINPNNESYYLEHPSGGYIQFDNKIDLTLQSGKFVVDQNSMFYVEEQSAFVKDKLLNEARRQNDTAILAGFKVEWLISDEKAVNQLNNFFTNNSIQIDVKLFPE